jgi:integrase
VKGIDKRISKDGTISYRARVRIKGHPILSKTFSSITLAKKWKKVTEVEIEKGRYFDRIEAQRHTLGEAIDRYINDILPSKPKNAKNVRHHLLWWKEQLGAYSLDAIKPSLLAEQRDLLQKEPTARGKLRSATTVVRYLASLSHLFTICIKEWNWMTDNPIRKISKPKISNNRVRFLEDEERMRLLEQCKKSRCSVLYLVVILALTTGMRYSEIMKLKKEDVDLEKEVITLQETKNGEVRSLPIVNLPLELLRNHIKNNPHEKIALIFPSPNDPKKPLDIRSAWDRAVRDAKISNFRFHDLRHTTASYLAMNGSSLLDIAVLLGHKDLQMTKRYAHLSQEHKRKIVLTVTEKILTKV